MTATTQAILRSLALSDPDLSQGEKGLFQRLIAGQIETGRGCTIENGPLLLTQKQAARALGVSRVTLWRMTKEGVFTPVEITTGNFRYRREEIEAVAREGRNATVPKRVGRPTLSCAPNPERTPHTNRPKRGFRPLA